MSGLGLRKGAFRKGAPFVFLWLMCVLPGRAAEVLCPADRVDEQVQVEYVYDGDTVRLSDGRKLRFVGVDTPELGMDDRPAEPMAEQARTALRGWLAQSAHLLLRHDREASDRYGRELAHAYFPNGDSVAARLLARGLGVSLVVPPNVYQAECRRDVERTAQAERRGLWALPGYRVLDAADVTAETAGFRRVQGFVARVRERDGDLWLHLGPRLSVHIDRADRQLFSFRPQALEHARLQVQGKIRPGKHRSYLRVRHPTALQVLSGRLAP
jgi:endonuclease YncB( thermonuclease family)